MCVFATGAAVDLTIGAGRKGWRTLPYLAGLAGSACLLAAGVAAMHGAATSVDLGRALEMTSAGLRLDPLAGLALTLVGGLGVFISLAVMRWSASPGRTGGHGTGAAYLLMLGSTAVVVTAADAFVFLFGWEALTVAFYVLAGIRRSDRRQTTSAWLTAVMGKASGGSLLLGFLLLAGSAHSDELAAWSAVGPGALHAAAYGLIVAGFAAKVGLLPTHVWMPRGYVTAPGPIRAGMAGLAVNVGFYGLWRMLGILGPPPLWLAGAVLVLGGCTALFGIAFASVQEDLNRVIAYSSVENAGVILVAYGVALTGSATHDVRLVAVGLLAASLQVLAHGLAKSALFIASGHVEADRGTTGLEQLRGIWRSHPANMAGFSLAALTLAGLPPTIGFVSAWFTLEALMQQFRVDRLPLQLCMAAATALVALTAGVAALCFARLVGLSVLGPRQTADPPGCTETGLGERVPALLFGLSCFALAAVTPWTIRYIADGLAPVISPAVVEGALRSPWVLQPVFPNFSILSPSWLFVAFPVAMAAVLAVATVLSRGRLWKVRRVPAWHSATVGVGGVDSYTPLGYTNALRHVLANILGTRKRIIPGPDRAPQGGDPRAVVFEVTAVEPIETYLYGPLRRAVLALVDQAKRLQSGRLSAYVGYMLAALLAVLIVAAALR
jgi:formate hydrogenlyase subunit 3/multisubunit Na+/H+ antiporter MnhD subunit